MDIITDTTVDPTIFRVQKSIDFIENNLNEEISIGDIAQNAHFSKYHFQRLFKQYTGYSVISYLRKRRLTRIAYELCVNQRRVIDVAFDLYFDYEQSLIRAFKKEFGVTPGAFRKHKVNILCTPKINTAILVNNSQSRAAFRPKLSFQHRVTLVGRKEYINIEDNYTNNITIHNQNGFMKRVMGRHHGDMNINLCSIVESIEGNGEGWYYMPAIHKDKATNFFDHPDEYEMDYHFSYYTPETIGKSVEYLKVKDYSPVYLDMYDFLAKAPYQQDNTFRYTVYDLNLLKNDMTEYSLHCPIKQ
jgi:AraC family transcriptional regulator